MQEIRVDCMRRRAFLDTPYVLPLEIIDSFLIHMNLATKVKLIQLNRPWQTFMDKNPRLWRKLDFGDRGRKSQLRSICMPHHAFS